MKALSLWQPWASMCCIEHPHKIGHSVKGFETRGWSTRYRGPLLIHAAQRFTNEERSFCAEPLIRESLLRAGYRKISEIPRGAIIGRVLLIDCHKAMAVYPSTDEYARAMGYYEHGRYAWELAQPELFPEPIPYRGQQGLFNVPDETLEDMPCQP